MDEEVLVPAKDGSMSGVDTKILKEMSIPINIDC
jgi:hypothetical protein